MTNLIEAAYNKIDRYLRNNLSDGDYSDYSLALDLIYSRHDVLDEQATSNGVPGMPNDQGENYDW